MKKFPVIVKIALTFLNSNSWNFKSRYSSCTLWCKEFLHTHYTWLWIRGYWKTNAVEYHHWAFDAECLGSGLLVNSTYMYNKTDIGCVLIILAPLGRIYCSSLRVGHNTVDNIINIALNLSQYLYIVCKICFGVWFLLFSLNVNFNT